jgi:outer membrane biosynthesis protein TonB
MNRTSTLKRGAVAATVLALGVAALTACSHRSSEDEIARLREENEALKAQVAGTSSTGEAAEPAAAEPASRRTSDDWSWADEPSRPAPAREARETPGVREEPVEEPKPRPIERAPRPRPVPVPVPEPEPEPEEPPTNLLSKPKPAPEPTSVTRVAASGSALPMRLETALNSGTAQLGEPVRATLLADVLDADGDVVFPAGTWLSGTVTQVEPAKRAKKKSKLAFHFDRAELPDGTTASLSAGQALEGEGWRKRDGAIIGGSAAGGAVLGQVLGGDTEATVGGAVLGGAIASGVLASRKGEDVDVPAGTELELRLDTEARVERRLL